MMLIIDNFADTVDFMLSKKRDIVAAKHFYNKPICDKAFNPDSGHSL